MSSFTEDLVVKKIAGRMWQVEREFEYHVGNKEGKVVITVPKGFQTDFASVPRLFWMIIPPDGKYTQAAVVHDFLYHKHLHSRYVSDRIFLEAMTVLEVPKWKRLVMYRAVRIFGGFVWETRKKGKKNEKSNFN